MVEVKGDGDKIKGLSYGVPGLRMCEKAGICAGLGLLNRNWEKNEIVKAVCDTQEAMVKVQGGECTYLSCPIAELVKRRRPTVKVSGETVVECEALGVLAENARRKVLADWPKWRKRMAASTVPVSTGTVDFGD